MTPYRPTFEDKRRRIHRLLGTALDELRSTWRPETGPTGAQGEALMAEARKHIAAAKQALDRAAATIVLPPEQREALSEDPAVIAYIAKELRNRFGHGGSNVNFEAAAREVIRKYGPSTLDWHLLDGALITIMSRHRTPPQPSPADPPVVWD